MTKVNKTLRSAASEALLSAGDKTQADDIAALEAAESAAQSKLNTQRSSLVERMVFGPQPELAELCSGAERMLQSRHPSASDILDTSMGLLAAGEAFSADKKISQTLRQAIAKEGAYGFTVPADFGGLGLDYSQLACLEEDWCANGLGPLAVEISGQLTIGSSALLGYGTHEQRSTFLPLIADGTLIAFALTEVGVGVNAKRVAAWVERDDEAQCWRLHAEGACSKLYITSATHGGLAAIVARKGQHSREIGLFIVQLPEADVDNEDHAFRCESSNVSAFGQNINSKLSFRSFPIPLDHEIQGNGIEVLFYCLRMGRCMLAAMSAGYQRMMAADAIAYARQREGVGGKIVKHELPRLGIAQILGGALCAQSLAHLSLAQAADGVDLTGLKDLTKSASARLALGSLVAAERVIGGRSLDNNSRITEARATMHAFGIVEGEDDLLRLGMLKDITAEFTQQHLQALLGVLNEINSDAQGRPLAAEQRIDKLGLRSFVKHPARSCRAVAKLVVNRGFWGLVGWVLKQAVQDVVELFGRLIPTSALPRYRHLPPKLGAYVRYSERKLRQCRWTYLGFNLIYQLELTRAQIPMQRLGKRIELLVSMAAVCSHASRLDASAQHLAELHAQVIKNELKTVVCLGDIAAIEGLRGALERVSQDLEAQQCSLLQTTAAQPHAHPWR